MGWLDGSDYSVREKIKDTLSISGDLTTATKSLLVSGPPISGLNFDDNTILLAVLSADGVPKIGDGYTTAEGSPYCVNVSASEVERGDNEKFRLYQVDCEYENRIGTNTLSFFKWNGTAYAFGFDESYYFESQQTTVHIDTSKDFDVYPVGAESSPVIGEDESGNIAGVDIQDHTSVLVVEHYKYLEDINFNNIMGALGKTNNSSFYGVDQGEALFAGVQEVGRTKEFRRDAGTGAVGILVKMQYRFNIGKNLVLGELPTFSKKDGTPFDVNGKNAWQYLWAKNVRTGDGSEIKNYTEKVQVHTVYGEADFVSILGITGTL